MQLLNEGSIPDICHVFKHGPSPTFAFMKLHINARILYLLVAFSPWACHLEWGGNNSDYLVAMEIKVLSGAVSGADLFLHPMILLPLLGQLMVLMALIHPHRLRMLAITGQVMLSLLVGLIFLSGLLRPHLLVAISTIPFLASSVLFYIAYRKVEWRKDFIP